MTTRTAESITAAERELRIEAVAYARGSVALEGFTLPAACGDADRRFIAGEITNEEYFAEYRKIGGLSG